MTERRTIPPILDNVKHFFIESEDVSDFSKDRLLGKTWEILDILCPLESTAEITLRVPCERLVELGLVSEKVAGEIQSRIVRKEQKDQPDEPQNIISFKRTANGFRILQTYISEEQQGGLCRIDEVINKEATLKKDGDNYDLIVRTRSDNFHLHALDRRWLSANYLVESEWREVKPSIRDFNRMLALVAEGLDLGCLGSNPLF